MGDELTEARAQGLLARDRDVLIAEEEDAVRHEGIPDRAEVGVGDVIEVDTAYLGTDHGGDGINGRGWSAHRENIETGGGSGNGSRFGDSTD